MFEFDCYEFKVVPVCGARINFNLIFVYRSTSTADRVYNCVLEYMGKIQCGDRKSAFCVFDNSNGHNIYNLCGTSGLGMGEGN